MSTCDLQEHCEGAEMTHYIVTRRPSDHREIVAVMYCCDSCGGTPFWDLFDIGMRLRSGGILKASGEVLESFIESEHAGQFLFLTL